MVDSSNGKLEETQEIQHQSLDEGKKVVVIEDVGDSRPADEFIKDIDIGDDDNDDDTADNNDSISKEEKSYQMEGSREMVEEKEISESIVESIEPVVPLSNDLNEAAVELPIASAVSDPIETKEKPNLEKTEGKTALVLSESNGLSLEETKLSNTTEKNESSSIAVIDAEASKRIEETDSSDEKKPIEGTGLSILKDNNTGESSGAFDEGGDKNVESSNAGDESEMLDVLEDTTNNPSIVSVTRRPLQPTSWRSCCGIFDFLRRPRR